MVGCPIQENGQSVGSILLVEDITERKRAEGALATSEERYRSLAEASHDMIYIIGKDGTVEYVNEFSARQFSLASETIIGKNMLDLFSEPNGSRQMENIRWVLEKNLPQYVEAPTSFPGGEFWLGTWLVPLKDNDGRAVSVMGVSRDITERKKAEKELRAYSENLEEMVNQRTAELQEALLRAQMADRLKSEFLANVNHELRTPLTNLILYYQMLAAHPEEKTRDRLDVIGRELQRLRSLIENMLDLSRMELEQMVFRIKPHGLNELVQNLVNDRRAMAEERGLSMVMETSPNLPPVWMDEAMLIQAVSNLLTNAINYTPPGGCITILTRAEAGDSGQAGVSLCVQDTGPGVSESDLPHIFDRFYRGSAGHESGAPGTGLGLAIVQEVIHRHHGRVSVENVKDGHGAIFSFWLPLEQATGGRK
jgi:PAS domain S-box-containing protein